MVFSSNPLALNVSDKSLESWLRETKYLEIIDTKTTHLNLSEPTKTSSILKTPLLRYAWALLSLFTINPLSKLTTHDLSLPTPSWTLGFIGLMGSYSFPSSPYQSRIRVHENVKRYVRNYAYIFVLFFACALYQMPLALAGLLLSLALWDAFRLCSDRSWLHQHPEIKQALVHITQCASIIIMFLANVHYALFCAFGISYTVALIHAAFRKLTFAKSK